MVLTEVAVDGIIAFAIAEDNPLMGVSLGRRLPLVLVDQAPRPGIPRLGIDDEASAQAAAAHLLALGSCSRSAPRPGRKRGSSRKRPIKRTPWIDRAAWSSKPKRSRRARTPASSLAQGAYPHEQATGGVALHHHGSLPKP